MCLPWADAASAATFLSYKCIRHTGYLCVSITEQRLARELVDAFDQALLMQLVDIQHQALGQGTMLSRNKG